MHGGTHGTTPARSCRARTGGTRGTTHAAPSLNTHCWCQGVTGADTRGRAGGEGATSTGAGERLGNHRSMYVDRVPSVMPRDDSHVNTYPHVNIMARRSVAASTVADRDMGEGKKTRGRH